MLVLFPPLLASSRPPRPPPPPHPTPKQTALPKLPIQLVYLNLSMPITQSLT